jgi:hypothetical protein
MMVSQNSGRSLQILLTKNIGKVDLGRLLLKKNSLRMLNELTSKMNRGLSGMREEIGALLIQTLDMTPMENVLETML